MATLIAALGPKNLLGRADGTLPWWEPCDMAIFTEHTRNKRLVVGPKTYNKLPDTMKKRNSFCVVMSRKQHGALIVPGGADSPTVVNSVGSVIDIESDVCVIIGGAGTYLLALRDHHKVISQCIIMHIRDPRDKHGNHIFEQPGDIYFSPDATEYLVNKFSLTSSFDISKRVGVNVWTHK